ncbi:MAG: hypothetical protein ACXW05_12145 [Gemmatirosa sp.]
MADWQGSTPGGAPGYGAGGQGGAWNDRRDANAAPWPQQPSSQPPQPPQPPAQPSAYPPAYPPYPQHSQHQAQQQQSQPTGGAIDQAKEKAQQLAGDVRQQATERLGSGLDRGKARAAETLGGVAQTLFQSSQQLREQQPQVGQYAERAAHEMQRFSDYLQRADVEELVDGVERLARRQPALFLGGMFALGVLGARFLRSSRRGQQPQYASHRETSRAADAGDRAYGADYGASNYGAASYGASAYGAADYGAASQQGRTGYGGYAGGYGAAPYGDTGYGATGTPSTAGEYGAGNRTPDRDVTDRQRIASEPPPGGAPTYGVGGTPALGQESYRRAESAWDTTPDERTQPGGARAADGHRTGGLDPRGGEQP